MNNGEEITFWNFLKAHSIQIPIIQRDYAQGRKGKEELRKRFLRDLKDAIANNSRLTMDFAYGSFINDTFQPLDGQQRLTTLWLVHWYVAYKAGQLPQAKSILQNFSYATRVSARDFCHKLCDLSQIPAENITLEKHIRNQNWFYSAWNQDPTIQSMLRMLSGTGPDDGIIKVLTSKRNPDTWHWATRWYYLTSQDCSINFRVLNISEIGQTDDLYVKMNARGKPLTSFENFKAELVEYIRKQAEGNPNDNDWGRLNDSQSGFGQKLDNEWTDIFWKLRSQDGSNKQEFQNRIDEICFMFFNRFFFNCHAVTYLDNTNTSPGYWRNHPLYGDEDYKLDFANLERYQNNQSQITKEWFQNIEKVLDRLPKLQELNNFDFNQAIQPIWKKEAEKNWCFLPEYDKDNDQLQEILNESNDKILKVTEITVKERAVFFAICQWLIKNEPGQDGSYQLKFDAFQDWMRVIWNIVENSDVGDNLPGALKLIDKLASHSHGILSFLASNETFGQDQLNEEREKARLILGWRGNHGQKDEAVYWQIKEAEKYPYLRGCIFVLFPSDNFSCNTDNNCQGRLELLKALIGNNDDEYHLIKVLISNIPDDFSLKPRIPLKKNEANWKDVLTKHLKSAFRNTQGDAISSTKNKKIWIHLLAATNVLNNCRDDGKILGNYKGKIVLYGTSGCTRNAYGNIILDQYHNLPSLAELIKTNIISGPIPVGDTSIFPEWNIDFKYNNTEYYISEVGKLWKRDGNDRKEQSNISINQNTTSENLQQFLRR